MFLYNFSLSLWSHIYHIIKELIPNPWHIADRIGDVWCSGIRMHAGKKIPCHHSLTITTQMQTRQRTNHPISSRSINMLHRRAANGIHLLRQSIHTSARQQKPQKQFITFIHIL